MSWFVVIRNTDGAPRPMWANEECDELALFDTEDEAELVADQNRLAQACGFEVYEWDE